MQSAKSGQLKAKLEKLYSNYSMIKNGLLFVYLSKRTDLLATILSSHLQKIKTLCKQHKVKRLWAFGSVLREDFRVDSDIDLLYEWDDQAIPDEVYLQNLWTLLDKLETLLGHKVDWVYYPNLKNPYFKAEVDETKVLLYDQEREKVAV